MTHFIIDLGISSNIFKPHAKVSQQYLNLQHNFDLLPRPVGGFLAAQVEGLVDAYKAYWSLETKNQDASLVPLPFDREKFSKRY